MALGVVETTGTGNLSDSGMLLLLRQWRRFVWQFFRKGKFLGRIYFGGW